MSYKPELIAAHIARISQESRDDIAAGKWDEIMTDALYAVCGAESMDDMQDARLIAEDLCAESK